MVMAFVQQIQILSNVTTYSFANKNEKTAALLRGFAWTLTAFDMRFIAAPDLEAGGMKGHACPEFGPSVKLTCDLRRDAR
jgi:hypothetical protein